MILRERLVSKSSVSVHKLTNVVDLIKKVKLKEKKEKRHTLLLVVASVFVLASFSLVIFI